MPSPFPGMDPYLEDPGIWPDVHHELISEARAVLGGLLRPRYTVRIEERVYISDENHPGRSVIIPDVRVAVRPDWDDAPFEPGGGSASEFDEPIVVTTMVEEEVREARLEVVDCEGRQVVTVIELLSPSNKTPGSHGRASYEEKRRQVLGSFSHLVEIDLLRAGTPFLTRGTVPPCEYRVHVSRASKRPKGLVWPIRLSRHLPTVVIPLKPGDPDVALDLQAVLSTAYDRAGYDLSIDYRGDPAPPLAPEWAAWADGLLRGKGLRTG